MDPGSYSHASRRPRARLEAAAPWLTETAASTGTTYSWGYMPSRCAP